MEVNQTKAEGLSRTFQVKVPQSELQTRLEERIEEIRPQMKLKGFRPGKVPASHVRRMFGKSLMGELVEGLVKETNEKAIADAELRPAGQPNVHMESDVEQVLEGEADLAYHMHVDIMPEFEPVDISGLSLDKPVAQISDAEIDETLGRIAEQNKQYEARGKTAKAREGDAAVIDFVGKIDGEPFEGGSAEEQSVVIGAGRFIPGFEEQLEGVKAGQELQIEVTFPEDYPAEHLAGKPATFDVTVREIREPKTPEPDDEFAKGLGLESLDQLKDMVRQQIQSEYDQASRAKAKRALLDRLDEAHDFELPEKMVDAEFQQIWAQLQQEKEAGRLDEDDAAKSDEQLEADYRKIAARRVRLGLVLAEIGRLNDIQINEQEVQQAMIAEARKYPGQERQVLEFFQKNPDAMANLRAPIYEEKVVDHILSVAQVAEKPVDKDTLFAEDDAAI